MCYSLPVKNKFYISYPMNLSFQSLTLQCGNIPLILSCYFLAVSTQSCLCVCPSTSEILVLYWCQLWNDAVSVLLVMIQYWFWTHPDAVWGPSVSRSEDQPCVTLEAAAAHIPLANTWSVRLPADLGVTRCSGFCSQNNVYSGSFSLPLDGKWLPGSSLNPKLTGVC